MNYQRELRKRAHEAEEEAEEQQKQHRNSRRRLGGNQLMTLSLE
jgi:hypothetical protein